MKSILLVGLGKFGRHIASELNNLGEQVMGIDHDEAKVDDAMSIVTHAEIGDSTNEEFLRTLGVRNFDVCIVAIGSDFQSSLETTSLLKELGAKMVIARAKRDGQAKFLLRNGADEVLYPEKQVAKWAAVRYSSDHILDYIELDEKHAIFEVTVPKEWVGKSIGQLEIRKKYNINVLVVKEEGKITSSVTPDTVLASDLTMLVLGEKRTLQKLFHI